VIFCCTLFHTLVKIRSHLFFIVKSTMLQMLISRFEEIKMLEDETLGEFYPNMSDLRNSMVSLGKTISDVKLIRKILRSLLELFRIKVTTIEESNDLE